MKKIERNNTIKNRKTATFFAMILVVCMLFSTMITTFAGEKNGAADAMNEVVEVLVDAAESGKAVVEKDEINDASDAMDALVEEILEAAK